MTQRERVIAALNGFDTDDLRMLVNGINCYSGCLENQTWLHRDDRDEGLASWLTGWGDSVISDRLDALIYSARSGDFHEDHEYWSIDDYNYPVSADFPSYDLDEIADHILGNPEDLRDWCLRPDMERVLEDALNADDEENTTDFDGDEDSDNMSLNEVRDVLADWFDEQQRPTTDAMLDVRAQCCLAAVRPVDPADVIAYIEYSFAR